MIDDNIGKTFGSDSGKKFDEYLEAIDFKANPKGKIPEKEKRMLMARITDEVAGAFNQKHLAVVEAAAVRTGMYLTIDGSNLEKAIPVKYFSIFLLDINEKISEAKRIRHLGFACGLPPYY